MRINNNFIKLNKQITPLNVKSNIDLNPINNKVKDTISTFKEKLAVNKYNLMRAGVVSYPAGVALDCLDGVVGSIPTMEMTAGIFSTFCIWASLLLKEAQKKLIPHIDFQKATSIAEAKDFAGDMLRIKKFKLDDLEFANWANEAITRINNRFKGQIFVPREIKFMPKDIEDVGARYSLGFDSIEINKYNFENLDESLKKLLEYEDVLTEYSFGNGYDDFYELITRANADLNSLSKFEKKALLNSIHNVIDAMPQIDKLEEVLGKEDIERCMEKSFKNINLYGPVYNSVFHIINHEMGHVFDRKSQSTISAFYNPKVKNADKLLLPEYTRSKKGELVADLFAGYMNGDVYLPSIDDLFNKSTKIRIPD